VNNIDISKQILLNEKDNVVVVRNHDELTGHKIARIAIREGEQIIKYGMPMGIATQDVSIGEHVHTHNCKTNLNDIIEYKYEPDKKETISTLDKKVSFKGYKRSSGEVGIRNELWIVPTVGCVNGVSNQIVARFNREHGESDNYDGIYTFNHQFGCSQMGDDHQSTKLSLQDMVKHPNAGGVLVLGLGCENNQVDAFRDTLGDYDESRVKFLIAQSVEDEVEAGLDMLNELFELMAEDQRVECPISDLKIGLECGGSDGFSGITANPLVGRVSDYVIANGGTSVLTEVPEMFGAETILMNRCINETVYNKTVDMVNGFKDYYKSYGQVIYENPSPGNKKGGITTLEDKSLGCTQKAGVSQVMDVLDYGERLKTPGLNLLSSPGNDIVATTALGMAGCQMVLFTTGRGTPFGGFIPTLKISTNSSLAKMKTKWIDFDAGRLLDATDDSEILEELIDLIIDVANGQKVAHEKSFFREIGFFKKGIIL